MDPMGKGGFFYYEQRNGIFTERYYLFVFCFSNDEDALFITNIMHVNWLLRTTPTW